MIYITRINLRKNTARAKHVRSLVIANKNLLNPLKFIFFDYKFPFKNTNEFIKFFFEIIFKKPTIYTRDIEYAFISAIFGTEVIFEIHQFGFLRKENNFRFIHGFVLKYLTSSRVVNFVTLTKSSRRVLGFIYPKLNKKRISVITDAANKPERKSEMKLINNRQINISYAGSFSLGKGGLETIELAKQIKNYNFNLAGNLNELKVRSFKRFSNIIFHKYLNDSRLIEFYEQSDILIAPIGRRIFLDDKLNNEITFYTSPLKLYEYLASNKPIVTVDRPCTRKLNHIPGVWIIEKQNYDNFKYWEKVFDKIIYCYKTGEMKKIMEKRDLYIYSWESRIKDMMNVK